MTDELRIRNVQNEDWRSVQEIKKKVGLNYINPSVQKISLNQSNKKGVEFFRWLSFRREKSYCSWIHWYNSS